MKMKECPFLILKGTDSFQKMFIIFVASISNKLISHFGHRTNKFRVQFLLSADDMNLYKKYQAINMIQAIGFAHIAY